MRVRALASRSRGANPTRSTLATLADLGDEAEQGRREPKDESARELRERSEGANRQNEILLAKGRIEVAEFCLVPDRPGHVSIVSICQEPRNFVALPKVSRSLKSPSVPFARRLAAVSSLSKFTLWGRNERVVVNRVDPPNAGCHCLNNYGSFIYIVDIETTYSGF